MIGYCTPDDVRTALQETSLSGPTNSAIVTDDIVGVSSWLRKQSGRHWYDADATTEPLPTTAESASTIRLDIPNSPHAQRGQIHHGREDLRYPVTTDGPYARIRLPHGFVETLTSLEVRDLSGDVTDWTQDSEYDEGVGQDYYVREEDKEGHGASYLYIRAAAIGARYDYDGLVAAAYDYGLADSEESWDDVRRGVALLTAAQLIVDDDVLTSIPDNAKLVGADTEADRLVDRGMQYLEPYL